jgi:UDP-glucose 4-epimerase
MSGAAVVCGAGGFLGAHIAAQLAAAGHRVIAVDRVPAKGLPAGSEELVGELPDSRLERWLGEHRPELLVHAAGPASVAASMDDPVADHAGTVGTTLWLLDVLRRVSPRTRFVYLSSAAVYGNPEQMPIAETAPVRPISPYGFHKRCAELLVEEFHKVYGVPAASLRIFSAYGRGLARQVLFDICRKAAADELVQLGGSGTETRDFIHGKDVGRAVRAIAERGQLDGGVYNLASGVETPIREIAERIVAVLSPGKSVRFSGVQRAGDPLRWRADVGRLVGLGFGCQVGVAEGVADYAEWYREVGPKS